MMIPVGSPGAQRILRVAKDQAPDGTFTIARSDTYNARIVLFVPIHQARTRSDQGHTSSVTVSASAGSMKAARKHQMHDGVMGLGRIGSKSRGKI